MSRAWVRSGLAAVAMVFAAQAVMAQRSVIPTRPRLLLSAVERTRLQAKVNANDPAWLALKARADTLATFSIFQYKFATNRFAPEGMIYYTYQGEGWYDATVPLAFAYQFTGDTKYSNKLIELAQEMIRAQSDPDNQPPNALLPIQLDKG